MIKPKYPKRADVSQLARRAVEHATGVLLTPPERATKQQNANDNLHKKGDAKNRQNLKKSN